ncbi:MAG TPA: PIN domain-containing protein [Acidobacteriaceae bacterium]|jgi:hypothetical protein|nr:PIN domain-containing protein [Acidobacteriaceae bacterium]
MRTAVDTNVISAIWAGDSLGAAAGAALGAARLRGGLVISPATYVELRAYPGATAEFVDEFLAQGAVSVGWNLGREVWLQAADRFRVYAERRRKEYSEPRRVIADYIAGAHAALHADRLMTFDQRVFQTDFPELTLVRP